MDQPIQGTILDISQQVQVAGIGRALFEGNVVVQARDEAGGVLAEQATTIQAPDAGTGGEGPWVVQLSIQATPGTAGQIVAFSTSPVDGSVMASAGVDVIYGQPQQPFLQIIQPVQGSVLDISQQVLVAGTGAALPEGSLIVRAQDAAGNVLAEQPTSIQSPGGQGEWSVQLSIQAQPGATGQIVVLSTSPADGSVVASAQVDVTFGEAVQSYILINQPAEGALLDIASPVTVSGTGGGLFEGNVVVQAHDASGSVLAEQPTIIQSPQAGTGGEGPWEVQLSIPAEPGSSGQIVAFSPSPADGSIMASAEVNVTYGQPEEPEARVNLEDHLWLLASLGGQEVLPGTQVTAEFTEGQVSGGAGCNQYSAPYETSDSSLTVGAAATTRMACEEPQGVMDQETQYLNLLSSAATYRIEQRQLSILDASQQVVLVYNAAVIGQVDSQPQVELPAGTIATITLADVSLADVPAVTIAEQIIPDPQAFPFPYTVVYDPQDINPANSYAIGVRITDASGNLLFINTSAYQVITRDNPSRVDVMVEPVS
ncbi:MAG: Gmad2 immunoglobulin-like domain-containing protein [Anaerolineales bacterium]